MKYGGMRTWGGDMIWMLNKQDLRNMDPDSSSSRYSPGAGSYEHGNQTSASIKGPQYLDCVLLLTCQQGTCFADVLVYKNSTLWILRGPQISQILEATSKF